MKNEQRIEEIKAEIAAAGGHLEGHICVHVEFEPDGSIAAIWTAGIFCETETATVYYDGYHEKYLTRFKDGSPDVLWEDHEVVVGILKHAAASYKNGGC